MLPIIAIAGLLVSTAGSLEATQTGSYTIRLTAGLRTDNNAKIKITAKADDGSSYDGPLDVPGKTGAEVVQLVFDALDAAGWNVSKKGDKIEILGSKGGPGDLVHPDPYPRLP